MPTSIGLYTVDFYSPTRDEILGLPDRLVRHFLIRPPPLWILMCVQVLTLSMLGPYLRRIAKIVNFLVCNDFTEGNGIPDHLRHH